MVLFLCACALSVIVCVVLCGSCFVFCVRCSMCVWSVVYVVVWFITVVWFVGVCVFKCVCV